MKSSYHINPLPGLLISRLTTNQTGLLLFLLLSRSELAVSQSGQRNRRYEEPYSYNGSISPPMAIAVMVVIAALFLTGFIVIYVRHCTGADRDESVRRVMNSTVARGIDAAVIETFPTFVYGEVKTQKIGRGALECAICLNEFGDDETLRLLPKCDHVFHPLCIDEWLAGHLTCPVCRTNLAEPVEPEVILITETDVEAQESGVPEPEVGDVTRVGLSRSHTTGHSVVLPGQNTNRFTLKLPEDLRKKLIANWKMNRSKSVSVLPRGGSLKSDKPVDSSKARSGRWFLWRNGSIKLGSTGSSKANSLPSPTGDSVRAVDRWAFLRNASFLKRIKDGEGSSSVQ